MDPCKNTRFSSYNQYNKLLAMSSYRKEISSTSIARIQEVEDRIIALQETLSKTENEHINNEFQPISVTCHVTFLNPYTEGTTKNPKVFELPTASTNRKINIGFHKIITTIPNNGIIGIKCFAEDGEGGFLVPHENARFNVYVFATPHSNENIELIWNEHNGLWTVVKYDGHFENVDTANISGSLFNIQESSLPASESTIDKNQNKIPNTYGWTNAKIPYTIANNEVVKAVMRGVEKNDEENKKK